ncbi:MAG TPA: nuclear transport factor 2 family protein [Jatrophihabitans sp.]|nr:nuclear transport factor 2 family protein [Jatrophihabitans sp.]
MSLWLRNATVIDPIDQASRTCWVELVPTGAVRSSDDPSPDGPVLDGDGIELELTPHAGIARALLAAIVAGDRAAADRLYADDLVVWHNCDGLDRDKAESLDLIESLSRDYVGVQASDVRCDYLVDGYVQRTAYRVLDHAGGSSTVETMMRVWVRDGRISRIEEYSTGAGQPTVPR